MIPPVYHSLRRESIKNASSASEIGVQSVRPTWFEDLAVPDGLLEDSHMPVGGHYTSMVPSGNAVFIDLQPSKNSTTC